MSINQKLKGDNKYFDKVRQKYFIDHKYRIDRNIKKKTGSPPSGFEAFETYSIVTLSEKSDGYRKSSLS